MNVRFTIRARADTFALWDDLATAGDLWGSSLVDPVDDAERFAGELAAACARIAAEPEAGRPRGDLSAGMRELACGEVSIYYRKGTVAVDVVRVLRAGEGGA